jgi:hypothetical protein
MPINGVTIIQEDGFVICFINELSDEIKSIIRNELSAICHGRSEVEEYGLERHSFNKTLSEFLIRYDPKSDNIKKGMMGEFIAHLIIHKVLPKLKTISILFNKEELSIRKGFDLTYVELEGSTIWYGEVKSGEVDTNDTPDGKNKTLLNDSKNGMREFLTGNRPNLWNSVIIDVGLSLAQNERKNVKELLDADITQIRDREAVKKNAILISVLFHNTQYKVTIDSIREQYSQITAEDIFEKIILFSIQKSTYSRIVEFLRQEALNQ